MSITDLALIPQPKRYLPQDGCIDRFEGFCFSAPDESLLGLILSSSRSFEGLEISLRAGVTPLPGEYPVRLERKPAAEIIESGDSGQAPSRAPVLAQPSQIW